MRVCVHGGFSFSGNCSLLKIIRFLCSTVHLPANDVGENEDDDDDDTGQSCNSSNGDAVEMMPTNCHCHLRVCTIAQRDSI